MKKEWLIAINREHAKIFEWQDEQLNFIKKFENPDGSLRKRDFETDRPGMNRTNQAGVRTVHAMTAEKDPTEHVEEVFASQLAVLFEKEVTLNQVTQLTLAAEPHMVGLLKNALASKAPKLSPLWLNKDIANFSTEKIEAMIKKATARQEDIALDLQPALS